MWPMYCLILTKYAGTVTRKLTLSPTGIHMYILYKSIGHNFNTYTYSATLAPMFNLIMITVYRPTCVMHVHVCITCVCGLLIRL